MHPHLSNSPSQFFCLRTDLSIVRMSGVDAQGFLHAQLTQSTQDMSKDSARPAAYCSAQGRVLANGVLWRSDADTFWFMVAQDLTQDLAQRLRGYVLRAKVRVESVDGMDILGVVGTPGGSPEAFHSAPDWSVHVVADQFWIRAPSMADQPPAWWCVTPVGSSPTAPEAVCPDPSGWRQRQLLAGWPLIRAATQGEFLPASLNMDLNGTVHFQKGCYPGQEVIARSHYRGSVKRRLAVGRGAWPPSSALPPNGCDLYGTQGNGRPCARLIEACLHEGQSYVAAEIMVANGAEQSLFAHAFEAWPWVVRQF